MARNRDTDDPYATRLKSVRYTVHFETAEIESDIETDDDADAFMADIHSVLSSRAFQLHAYRFIHAAVANAHRSTSDDAGARARALSPENTGQEVSAVHEGETKKGSEA